MPDISQLIISFILGIIEGITEFLPISSTGHVIIVEYYLNGYIDSTIHIFIIIIQLGTFLSTIITFWNKLYNKNINYISNTSVKKYYQYNYLYIYHILIGTVPGILIGIIFHEKIKLLLLNPIYVMYGLIFGSIFLLISEWNISKVSSNRISNINNINYSQSFLIGCIQCLAFCPGFSRSGATIAGGLLVGLNRQIALEFSFLLAIPIILGSITFTIYHNISYIKIDNILCLVIGNITAFVTSFFTIKFLLKIIQNISFIPFIIYRLSLASIIYLLNK